MNSRIYRQADSDWATLPYPTKHYIFARNACGACSVTHCAIEVPGQEKYTPKTTYKFMVQYAKAGHGTEHIGIVRGLEHYGYNVHWNKNDSMSTIFTTLKQSTKIGVILFSDEKTPDKTVWTSNGHYIAFVNYRVKKNGTHEFYLKDSGGRHHDGWWSYEKSMKGAVKQVFIGTSFKKDGKKKETKKSYERVIDVSYAQSKSIDWEKVKADGIKGVIIRCGYRGYGSGKLQEDSMFMTHAEGAMKAGLKVGIYMFTEGITAKEGKEEAQFALHLLEKAGIKPAYPIAVDTEHINPKPGDPVPRANGLSKAKRTKVIKAFCEEIKAQGYEPMIYGSTNWLHNNLNMAKLPYKVWVAQYYSIVTYSGSYVMWQYSSKGSIDGIKGNVDLNRWYSKTAKKTEPKKEEKPVRKLLEVGSKIKIKKGACQYGKSAKFADFVYERTYKVKSIAGKRVVFTTTDGKTVIGAVSSTDCIVQ